MDKKFKLNSSYKPTADQKNAIGTLTKGVLGGDKYQTLLGVTGSGKTFTAANVIKDLQRPALIISHNKTLAAQLYQEFRDFFPNNAVSYFVSYYDYYQPEAYIPSTDTYIEKDAQINDLIDKLRLGATTNLLTRKDVVVIASVSAIYNIGSPKEYGNYILELKHKSCLDREEIIKRLVDLQYERAEFGFHRGSFRVRGDTIDIFPAYQDTAIRVGLSLKGIDALQGVEPASGKITEENLESFVLYPAKHYIANPQKYSSVFLEIERDLKKRVEELKEKGMELEAHRLAQRVTYDLDMIKELGYVKGIENYSRYFDGRKKGEAPHSLLEYFNHSFGKDWLLFIDESHITFPQIRGMYNGDLARKKILVDYGFRLPASFDNRPLKFEEFMRKIPGFIALSATPNSWEISMSQGKVVQQLLRPTGIPDPVVSVRSIKSQVKNVISEIKKRAKKGQRSLVTTLTKATAEDLSEYLKNHGVKVHYLHSDIKTLERTDILDELRGGKYDCLVGINLLREGLDLPEVSLVAILDADKEGFLRSEATLIQTMGRAARHVEGEVIMYADKITGSIERALSETKRRREYQIKTNKKYGIIPKTIVKPIRKKLVAGEEKIIDPIEKAILSEDFSALTPMERRKLVKKLEREMRIAAQDLNFELAIELRERIKEI